jgi:hypothetical protein
MTRACIGENPNRTFISKEEKSMPGNKVAKDRFTLLLGDNSAGDFKLKTLLVYRWENPRALKGIEKSKLPVIWMSNRKAWLTRTLFENWFTKYFCPAVNSYCTANQLPNKALLILDNAPAHPTCLDELSSNVKVVFLPPNTPLYCSRGTMVWLLRLRHTTLEKHFPKLWKLQVLMKEHQPSRNFGDRTM